jgi:hypothetical protein
VFASPFLAPPAPEPTTGLVMDGAAPMLAPEPIVLQDGLPPDSMLFLGAPADATESDTDVGTDATQATAVRDLVALPDATASTSDLWLDAAGLMAAPNPIVLPDFTVPGDETAALMLPAAPEISHLPGAFAAAAHRFTARAAAVITFIDPVTGEAADHSLSVGDLRAQDQAWLLVDPSLGHNSGAVSSRIRWDSHPQ